MSKNSRGALEAAANVSFVIGVVLLVSFSAIRTFSTPAHPSAQEGVAVGTSLMPDEHSSAWPNRTVLVVVSSTCRFCTASMDFYRQLSQQVARNAKLSIRFVSAESADTLSGYLQRNGLAGVQIGPLPPGYSIGGTPTLLMLDRDGRVSHGWLGQLSSEQEEQVVAAVLAGEEPRW
jgi:hypothetical protein